MSSQKTIPETLRWIWPFELLQQIGEGGMGVVYRARYVVNNRLVALKMLPGDVTDKIALARFERELDVLKNLKHPNIVRCFGGVSEDKQRFYAMELVEGGSLEDELQRRGKLSVEAVMDYGLQMCAALECSHKSGVIHRDIKPSNFLIGQDRQLKLSDFGLASVSASRRITAAGKTAGTLLYMSPEQIRGGELTPQTDLYALGCLFFELLTGHPPYVGESPAATMHMHCRAEIPRVATHVLDCPQGLDRLIAKLMAKDPAQRPVSASDVARELRSVSHAITIKIDPKRLLLETPSSKSMPPVMRTDLKDSIAVPRRSSMNWPVIGTLGGALAISLLLLMTRDDQSTKLRQLEQMWVDAVQDPEHAIRLRAIENLSRLNGESIDGVQAISRCINDPDPGIRRAAILGLSKSGIAGKPHLPALMTISKEDQDRELRDLAGRAVAALKVVPDQRRWGSWLAVTLLLLTVMGVAYRWIRSTSKHEGIPPRRPVLN